MSVIARQSPSFNSSAASSSLNDAAEDLESEKVRNYVKEMLKSRIFLGRYIERRLIDQHIGYRDVVVVSPAEVDLRRDLTEAQHKLRVACPTVNWIGITTTDVIGYTPASICLWTEIDNQPFGAFWFQIKSLKFRDAEVIVTLKCIRHLTEAFIELEPILTGATKKSKEKTVDTVAEDSGSLNDTLNEIKTTLRSALSITNVKEFITFIFAFIIAIFTGSTAFVNFLGNFILALLRETSILIKNSTPAFLGVVDFFSKCVGGFYILLAMIFKPNTPHPINRRSIGSYDQRKHYNQYDDGHFD